MPTPLLGQKTARQVSRQVSITSLNNNNHHHHAGGGGTSGDHQKSMDVKATTTRHERVGGGLDHLANTSYERVTPNA